jgi:hypothetical protein
LLALLGAHHILHISRIRVNNAETVANGVPTNSNILLRFSGSIALNYNIELPPANKRTEIWTAVIKPNTR